MNACLLYIYVEETRKVALENPLYAWLPIVALYVKVNEHQRLQRNNFAAFLEAKANKIARQRLPV